MADEIRPDDLDRMLRGAIRKVREGHEELSRLDSFGGDGDHGTTMVRAMGCVEKVLGAPGPRPPGKLLGEVGWALLGVDGGATGPLFGSFFLGMAEAAGEAGALGPAALAGAIEAGLAGVRKRTKAMPGDKTMVDALVPAAEAARKAADGGDAVTGILGAAAAAAARGAEGTAAMAARFGRAKNVGQKSIGARDPGATSVSLIFSGFLEGFTHHG